MATATTSALIGELVGLIKAVPAVGQRGFSVFNSDELEEIGDQVGFPLAGVAYEGAAPQGHTADSKTPVTRSAAIIQGRFLVLVAISYKSGATDLDNKPSALDLLDQVRSKVMGYRGINTRPWGYVGESPLETRLEGVVMYGQLWETGIPVIGNNPPA